MLIYESKSVDSFKDYGIFKIVEVSSIYNERLAFRTRYFQEMIFLIKVTNSFFNEYNTRYEDYIKSLTEFSTECNDTVIKILGTPYAFRLLMTTPKVVYMRKDKYNINYNSCSRIAIWENILTLGGHTNNYRKIYRIKVPYAKKCALSFETIDFSDQVIKTEKISVV